MHDVDNACGLKVANTKGESWTCYGDTRLFEDANKENCRRLKVALQVSVDEVYEAFTNRTIPSTNSFKVFDHIPTFESALSSENPLPMFLEKDNALYVRRDVWTPRFGAEFFIDDGKFVKKHIVHSWNEIYDAAGAFWKKALC